jgi:hypothetical protein
MGNREDRKGGVSGKPKSKPTNGGAKFKVFKFLLKKSDIRVKFGQPLEGRQEYFHFLIGGVDDQGCER